MELLFQSLGLLALLGLIPFLIIYLRRPKTYKRTIPSLMFLSANTKSKKKRSFLRNLIRNWVFYLQLIALTSLLLAYSQPMLKTDAISLFEDVIIIIDDSASTYTVFDSIKQSALNNRGRTTSVITSSGPHVHAQSARYDQAHFAIARLPPGYGPNDMEGALSIAIAHAQRHTSADIVIITDAQNPAPQSYIDALLQSGHSVRTIIHRDQATENVGIIDARITSYEASITIKNHGSQHDITIRGPLDTRSATMPVGSVLTTTIPLQEGRNIIRIEPDDARMHDNTYFISNNARASIDSLIVSTSEQELPIHRALRAINTTRISIEENRLGTISRTYDLIILSDYSPELILSSFYTNALEAVRRGGVLIIGHSSMNTVPHDILPVDIQGRLSGTHSVTTLRNELTEGVDLTPIRDPLIAFAKENTIVLGQTQDTVVLAAQPYGAGLIIYDGYRASDSLSATPSYPILISNIVQYLTGAGSILSYQLSIGDQFTLPEVALIETPTGTLTGDTVIIDRPGFYRIGDTLYAANSIYPSESELTVHPYPEGSRIRDVRSQSTISIIPLLAILALIALILEYHALKRRGDI